MALNTTTGTVNVTGSVLAVPMSEKTLTSVTGKRDYASSAGTTTLGTVPANKVWRILNATMFAIGSGTAGTCTLNFEGVTHLRTDSTTFATASSLGSVSQAWNYYACPKLAAGQTITLVSSAAGNPCSATVQYVEEAA